MKRFALALFLTLAGLASAHALTLSEIETAIRRNMRDTSTDSTLQRYSDSLLLDFINEEQRQIVNLTWCVDTSTSYVLTSGTVYYDLPTDLIAVKQVLFTDRSNSTIWLDEWSERKVYQQEPSFATDSTGEPRKYFTRSVGSTALQIAYLPYPNTTSSTGTVTVFYYNQATDLASSSDVPFDGAYQLYPYHWTIVVGVTARLKAIEGLVDEAKYYSDQFTLYVTTMKEKSSSHPNYSPSLQASPR